MLLGGAAVVRGNTFEACGGAGVHIVGQCMAALERNKIRECLVGLHIGDASASLRLDGNMFKNNGNSDDCATDLPPGCCWACLGHRALGCLSHPTAVPSTCYA